MSLKAKLEAVIYAAEEPVTLAQLAALFAEEALAWKAEQEAASAAQTAASATSPEELGEPLLLLGAEFDDQEADRAGGASATPEQSAETPEQNAENVDPAPEALAGAGPAAAGMPIEDEANRENAESGSAAIPEASLEADSEAAVGASPADEAAASAKRLARLRDREVRAILRSLLDELIGTCASDSRGVEIREIAGGFRMATKPECFDAVRAFVTSLKPPFKLSSPALETLAVIAYKQPVTAPEVNEIRGVDSSAVFGSLLARKLIATAGRKPVIGRPILYKTTREFLLHFGLKDLSELPSMEEFEKMVAAELAEPPLEAEGESAPEIGEDLRLELDRTADGEPADETAGSAAEESPAEERREAAEAHATTPEAAPAVPPRTE